MPSGLTQYDGANIGWVRKFCDDMQRHSTGRMYLNFPGHGEGKNLVRDAFGVETYGRLQKRSATTIRKICSA